MPFSSLRQFIDHLENQGNLVRITEPISTFLEMTEIQTRLLAEQGPAVLFERPITASGQQAKIPVVVNLFGTLDRVAAGIEKEPSELREIGRTLAFLRQPEPPGGWREAISMLPLLKTAMTMKPTHTSNAPCQEIVLKGDDADLGLLPVQTCWPGEPSPLITWPLVVTQGTATNFNIGIYRMQVLAKDRAIMRWLRHRGGAQHFARWKELKPGTPMPTAVIIGADPGTIIAAVTPTPDTLSEYHFAGLLRGKKVRLTDAITIPIKVPANAEIVIEGHVMPQEQALEGPFGDHTGYYNAAETFPVFQVSAITMRKDPIYLSTFTGRAPDEPSVLAEALNEMFIPLIQQQFPEITDFWLPPEACSYRVAVVAIKKVYPGHAKRIMMGIWSYLQQFMYTKWVIIVDHDIEIRDWKEVIWAIATKMDPERDTTIINNTPIDYLDFASPVASMGSKIGLDATTKIPPETEREWGKTIRMTDDIIDTVTKKWPLLGLPGTGKPIWK